MELMEVTYSKYLNCQSKSDNGQSKIDKEDFIQDYGTSGERPESSPKSTPLKKKKRQEGF